LVLETWNTPLLRPQKGGPFELGDQEPISSHRELLRGKAVVVFTLWSGPITTTAPRLDRNPISRGSSLVQLRAAHNSCGARDTRPLTDMLEGRRCHRTTPWPALQDSVSLSMQTAPGARTSNYSLINAMPTPRLDWQQHYGAAALAMWRR
jgi:hypothetical protein